MDDGRLRAVLTAVDRGSFSKAAAELGYTQSAMTHLVNNLEAELGCTLLNRGSHGVRLSEEGEHLLPYIKGVIDACDALRQEAAAQSRTQRHQLSLGCFASIARSALPQLLQEFKALYPDIQIDVTIRGYEMPALLQKGEVQLALVDETCAEGFEWIPLTRVPLIAVVPPKFHWEKERISIDRLLKERLSPVRSSIPKSCCRRTQSASM
jgi:DNA-binding transcriptional LysR family regulator